VHLKTLMRKNSDIELLKPIYMCVMHVTESIIRRLIHFWLFELLTLVSRHFDHVTLFVLVEAALFVFIKIVPVKGKRYRITLIFYYVSVIFCPDVIYDNNEMK
jgi:hypothetical protein